MNKFQSASESIIDFRFSLHPMTGNFIDVIKRALRETDTTKVWMHTDDVSTVIRGKKPHVFNTAKSIALHAAKTGAHVAMSGTFSVGYQKNSTAEDFLHIEDTLLNIYMTQQYVSSQFAIYAMNTPSYMDLFQREIERAKKLGLFNESMHHAPGIHGDIHDVFTFYEEAFSNASTAKCAHLVMTVSFSFNSPSHGK